MWLMKEKSKTKTEGTNELQWKTRMLMNHRNTTGNAKKQTKKSDPTKITKKRVQKIWIVGLVLN